MRTRSLFLAASLSAGLFLFTSGAHALSIDSSNSGLDQAQGCSSPGCFPPTDPIYGLSSSGTLGGTLDIAAGVLTFSITLDTATLTGPDGPVTSVDFTNVTYAGSVDVTLDGSNNYTVDGGQAGSVTATLTPNGAGSPTSINASTVLVTGVCSGTPGTALDCGLIFGPLSDFTADVNGNTRYFTHTVDAFTIVPEPGTALLMGLGMMGLAIRRKA